MIKEVTDFVQYDRGYDDRMFSCKYDPPFAGRFDYDMGWAEADQRAKQYQKCAEKDYI